MLQGALCRGRSAMADHGVIYAGRVPQHYKAAEYVIGSSSTAGSERKWLRLVNQVAAAADHRVLVSSEAFAGADQDRARFIVERLGGPRVHVLVTLRPLAKILPSAWQQYVRNRLCMPYDEWLDRTLNGSDDEQVTPSFWRRHHHDVLVERWASIVGPRNLTVVVFDPADPFGVLRTVERLTGLPPRLLEPADGRSNRSLTYGESELVRQINTEFERRGWSYAFYREVVRPGVIARLQLSRTPGPDEAPIITPKWALDRAAEIGAAAAARIAGSGVHVVGDLSVLGALPNVAAAWDPSRACPVVPSTAAANAVMGTIDKGVLPVLRETRRKRRKTRRKLRETRQKLRETRRKLRQARQKLRETRRPHLPAGDSARRTLSPYTSAELLSVLAWRAGRRLRHPRRPTPGDRH